MKPLIILILTSILIISCSRTTEIGLDIIGEWLVVEQSCDSCLIFEFKSNDSLTVTKTETGLTSSMYYHLNDSKIDIEYMDKLDEYNLKVYNKDEVEIIGFVISNIPEEYNTKLKRIQL